MLDLDKNDNKYNSMPHLKLDQDSKRKKLQSRGYAFASIRRICKLKHLLSSNVSTK